MNVVHLLASAPELLALNMVSFVCGLMAGTVLGRFRR